MLVISGVHQVVNSPDTKRLFSNSTLANYASLTWLQHSSTRSYWIMLQKKPWLMIDVKNSLRREQECDPLSLCTVEGKFSTTHWRLWRQKEPTCFLDTIFKIRLQQWMVWYKTVRAHDSWHRKQSAEDQATLVFFNNIEYKCSTLDITSYKPSERIVCEYCWSWKLPSHEIVVSSRRLCSLCAEQDDSENYASNKGLNLPWQ